jgi:hypothetical protein
MHVCIDDARDQSATARIDDPRIRAFQVQNVFIGADCIDSAVASGCARLPVKMVALTTIRSAPGLVRVACRWALESEGAASFSVSGLLDISDLD